METMNIQKETKARKQKGIRGRTSKADIQKRINIGITLLIKKDFPTKKSFIKDYKNCLIAKNLQVPTNRTLSKDLDNMKGQLKDKGITFHNMEKTSAFERIGDSIKGKIGHIKISVNGYENTLFDEQHTINLKNYKKFKAPFLRLYKKNGKGLITTNTRLRHFPMVHLYIITCEESKKAYNTDLSTYIINIFLQYLNQEILYASAHHNCAEIVFYKKNYDLILFHTFCLTSFACS